MGWNQDKAMLDIVTGVTSAAGRGEGVVVGIERVSWLLGVVIRGSY